MQGRAGTWRGVWVQPLHADEHTGCLECLARVQACMAALQIVYIHGCLAHTMQ